MLGALAALCTTTAGAAGFTASVRAASGTTNLGGPTDTTTRTGATGWTLEGRSTITQQVGADALGTGRSEARAYALPGGVQLYADADSRSIVSSGSMSGSGSATASGSVDDAFALIVPACANPLLCGAGRKGFMTFAIGVDGTFSGSGGDTVDGEGGLSGWSVSGGWSADVRVNAGFISGSTDPTSASYAGGQGRSQTSTSEPVFTGTGSFGMREFTVAFLFGQAINVRLGGSVNASSNSSAFVGSPPGFTTASGVSSFRTDLFHTIAWQGISEVRDATGQPLQGWTAVSVATGFDYAQPYIAAVPESRSGTLLLAGLALLGWRGRVGSARE
jgi:hypothetical protein